VFELLWDLYQQRRIGELQSDLNRESSKVIDVKSTIQALDDRIDKLFLINLALWSLLKEKTDLKDEDLLERIKEIDLSDGKLDGKVRQPAVECPQCKRKMSVKHQRCLYCGFQYAAHQAIGQILP